MTPQDRLAAAIYIDNYEFHDAPSAESIAQSALAADPTIAADMERGAEVNAEKRLQFHPLTGDPDFSYASLSDRLDTLERHNKSAGLQGYLAALKEHAADMELGRRIRDANDPLLRQTIYHLLDDATVVEIDEFRAALTEGEK